MSSDGINPTGEEAAVLNEANKEAPATNEAPEKKTKATKTTADKMAAAYEATIAELRDKIAEMERSAELKTPPTPAQPDGDPRRLVRILIQRPPGNSKAKGTYVSANTHRFYVPYDKEVEVPYFIAEILKTSSDQDRSTREMIDKLTGEYEADAKRL